MKYLFITLSLLVLSGCASTHSNQKLAGDQFIATYTDKEFGSDSNAVVSKIMSIAQTQCGNKEVDVMSISNTPRAFGSFPQATMIYKCR